MNYRTLLIISVLTLVVGIGGIMFMPTEGDSSENQQTTTQPQPVPQPEKKPEQVILIAELKRDIDKGHLLQADDYVLSEVSVTEDSPLLNNNLKNIYEYLDGIYNSVLLKDIVARLKISDVIRLESVVKYIFDNIGNLTSISKIANTLTSMGRKTDTKTIEKYIKGLVDGLLIYEVSRYNIKGKEFLATLSKYYVSDLGLRQMILGNRNIDMGHILENIIYLELLRRKVNVYVGQFDKNEVDFVVINSNEIEYYQVALTVLDENTLERELAAFKNIKDNYPKYLITLDDVLPNTDYDGIKVINALEWLLEE